MPPKIGLTLLLLFYVIVSRLYMVVRQFHYVLNSFFARRYFTEPLEFPSVDVVMALYVVQTLILIGTNPIRLVGGGK